MKLNRLALAVGSGLLGMSAQAATITVTTTEDGSIAGECTLRDAIRSANGNQSYQACAAGEPGLDEIVFAAGVEGVIELTEFESEGRFLPVTEPLMITGPGSEVLTIDALYQQMIFVINSDAPSTLTGLTLTGGIGGLPDPDSPPQILTFRLASAISSLSDVALEDLVAINNHCEGYSGPVFQRECLGGAIRVAGNALITNSTITDNTVYSGSGGGIHIDGTLEIQHSTISDNQASGNSHRGGGIYAEGEVIITDSNFHGNETTGLNGFGGAIAVVGSLELADSTISHNKTLGDGGNGGGLWVNGNLAMVDSEISYNSTVGDFARGGGLRVVQGMASLLRTGINNNETFAYNSPGGGLSSNGTLVLDQVTVSQNQTLGEHSPGGGIHATGKGTLSIDQSTIAGNMTSSSNSPGGGLHAEINTELVNSTISENATEGQDSPGGGIHVIDANIQAKHVSLVNNQASDGADSVYSQEYLLASNTLIANDHANAEACNKYLHVDSTNNLVTDDSCGTASLVGGQEVDFSSLKLGVLTNNGGPTPTHAILSGSVAVAAADADICAGPEVASVDQRGLARPGQPGGGCDVGAFEVQPLPDEIFADRFL